MILYSINKHDLEDNQHLRNIRGQCVFSIINRGKFWYDSLTEDQLVELRNWYNEWLDITDTKIVPKAPQWLEVEYEEVL